MSRTVIVALGAAILLLTAPLGAVAGNASGAPDDRKPPGHALTPTADWTHQDQSTIPRGMACAHEGGAAAHCKTARGKPKTTAAVGASGKPKTASAAATGFEHEPGVGMKR